MSSHRAMPLTPHPLGIGLAGSWTLPSARAVTLGAASSGFLQVAHGTVWATLNGPHQGPANDWGDRVLGCGTRMRLLAGQQVVLEPYQSAANEVTRFRWEPDAGPSGPMSRAVTLRNMVGGGLAWLGRHVTPRRLPTPAWPRREPLQSGEQARQAAWRNLRQLRINPP